MAIRQCGWGGSGKGSRCRGLLGTWGSVFRFGDGGCSCLVAGRSGRWSGLAPLLSKSKVTIFEATFQNEMK